MELRPTDDLARRRASFLAGAPEYARFRPGYPAAAIAWVMGARPGRVVDLGCGPGNLTAQLRDLGHDAVGVDQSPAMLYEALRRGLRVVRGVAEFLPFVDACADAVTAGTAFHWFDRQSAVPEMRRVLVEKGRVALLTNIRDETVPWVNALSDIIGSEAAMAATLGGVEGMEAEFTTELERAGLFHGTEWCVFEHAQELRAEELVGLLASRSYIAILPDGERNRLLAGVVDLCARHPDLRGKTSFLMPYKTYACRSFAA